MIRRKHLLVALALTLLLPAIYSMSRPRITQPSDLTLVSAGYRLDKIYHSMEGPWSVQSRIQLAPQTLRPKTQTPNSSLPSSTIWITGVETEVVDAADQRPVSQEFFCHSNLTFAENSGTPDLYNNELGGKTHLDWRLFSLVPGQLSLELPPGFGVPVPGDAPLDYVTMSLNLNPRKDVVNVRMKTKIHTVAADQPGAPTKALFRRAVYVLQHENESPGVAHGCSAKPGKGGSSSDHMGAGCGELIKVTQADGSTALMPAQGMTNHWIVPRGDHVYTMDISPQLNLPFDTTIHYATFHVHPFARGMELRDLTTGKTLFHLNSHDWPDRIGVAHVDEFKSVEGIPIFKSHQYELTVEYNNTSDSPTDAMAILYLYLLEKNLG